MLLPGGGLMLVDLFPLWLAPTLIGGHRGKARTRTAALRRGVS
jgi:hypothetical protein